MQIVLYYAPYTCALAPYITLTEAGAEFETRPINLRIKQQMTPEYLKLNPKHKVPLLVVDGATLTENVAIHSWVDANFPEAGLLPADPWDRLQAISLHSWCSGGIHPYLARINNPPNVCDVPGATDSVVAHATEALNENFAIADNLLAGKEYFFGDFTAPDAHFYWCCRRAGQLKVDISGFANVAAHFARMENRPSVQKLLAFEKQVLDDFSKAA